MRSYLIKHFAESFTFNNNWMQFLLFLFRMWEHTQDIISLIYKSLFFQNGTGQNQGKNQLQTSTQKQGHVLRVTARSLLRYL